MTLQRVLAAVAATVLAQGVVAPGPAAATTTETAVPSIVIATYNIRHALADDVATADVARLASAGVDVIALQEMGSAERRAAVRKRLVDCTGCAFSAYMPSGAGPGEVPILFRTAQFQLVGKGQRLISEATYVGPDGAGPSTIGPKYLTYVQLRHRATGQLLYVVNNHAVASVQAADGGPNYDHPERLALYRKHMDALSSAVADFEATGAAVFTTGDFNVNYRRDSVLQPDLFPYSTMKRLGVFASYKFLGVPETGTHSDGSGNDSRLIDYVSSSDHPAVVPAAQSILTGYRSDHLPVTVRYTLATAPSAPAAVTARALERSATVSWTPAADNGRPVQGYTVTTVETGTEVSVGGEVSSTVVPGLREDADYTFVVRADNRVGTGPPSPESNAVTPYAVPPETRIDTGPGEESFVTSSAALFGYTSSVAGSSFTCSVDGVARACGTSSLRVSGLTPATHTFGVTARDGAGDVDPSPATRSWTVPLGSSALSRTAAWSPRSGRGYYTGEYLTTTRRSATLTRRVSDARRLALVATTGPRHGSVRVYLGSTLLRRLDLAAGTLTKGRVVPLARFATAQSGKVRVVVASSGRPVRIEGLGVSTK